MQIQASQQVQELRDIILQMFLGDHVLPLGFAAQLEADAAVLWKRLKNIRKSLNIFQFLGISQKKTEIPQNRFLRHFRVETFPC